MMDRLPRAHGTHYNNEGYNGVDHNNIHMDEFDYSQYNEYPREHTIRYPDHHTDRKGDRLNGWNPSWHEAIASEKASPTRDKRQRVSSAASLHNYRYKAHQPYLQPPLYPSDQVHKDFRAGSIQSSKKPKTFKHVVSEFADITSIQGIPFIKQAGHWWSTLIWSVCFMGLLATGIWQTYGLFVEYFSWPYTVSIDLEFEQLAFPSVTVCNINPVRRSKINETMGALEQFVKKAGDELPTQLQNPKLNQPLLPGQTSKDQSLSSLDQVPPSQGQSLQSQEQVPPSQDQSLHPQGQVSPVQGHVPPSQNQAPALQGHILPSQSQMSPSQGHVPPPQSQAPALQGHILPSQSQMSPTQGHVPPSQSQAPASQGHILPSQGQTSPSQGHILPSQGQVPASQGHVLPSQGQTSPSQGHILPSHGQEGQQGGTQQPNQPADQANTRKKRQLPPRLPPSSADDRVFRLSDQTSDAELKRIEFYEIYGNLSRDVRAKISHQPEDFIIDCSFSGQTCSYQNFSSWLSPEYGQCYTFNSPESLDSSMRSFTSGKAMGLILTLYVQEKDYISEVIDGSGAVLSLGSFGTRVRPEVNGLSLSPGQETMFGIRLTNITRLGLPYGNCSTDDYFSEFEDLRYTKEMCMYMCPHRRIASQCKCYLVPFDNAYSRDDINTLPPCNLDLGMHSCAKGIMVENALNSNPCGCFPPCWQQDYQVQSSFNQWPHKSYQVSILQKACSQNNDLCDAFEAENPDRYVPKNFLKVRVYYQELNFQTIAQTGSYGLLTFVSDIGGTLGLYIGVSFLTAIELLDLLFKICRVMCRKLWYPTDLD